MAPQVTSTIETPDSPVTPVPAPTILRPDESFSTPSVRIDPFVLCPGTTYVISGSGLRGKTATVWIGPQGAGTRNVPPPPTPYSAKLVEMTLSDGGFTFSFTLQQEYTSVDGQAKFTISDPKGYFVDVYDQDGKRAVSLPLSTCTEAQKP